MGIFTESGAQSFRDSQLNAHLSSIDADDALSDRIDAMRDDAAKVAEADSNWSGTLDGGQYSAIESALADLDDVPADRLIGSDALAQVLRLAKVCAEARNAALLDMAASTMCGARCAA